MSEVNLAEFLDARIEDVTISPHSKDRRKSKKSAWKNAYAEMVFKHFEQIETLIASRDTIYSLFEALQKIGVFTKDANYRSFDLAYNREKQRRENPQRKIKKRTSEAKKSQPMHDFSPYENLTEAFKPDFEEE